ncbi:MAG: hypothetical protein IJT67_00720 [Lachnospiraceae bacterium]|nr:hypothetical protein [Lachnospiraceae bacterium]
MNRYREEYSRRTNRPGDGILIARILVSFFVIVVSIAAIYVVVRKVMDIKILEKISLQPETHDSISITTDTNSGSSLFITDDKGLRFRKEDKSFAREEWIEKNGELFYFDTAGYGLNGELKNEGQVYHFENGKLKNITRDTSYVYRSDDDLFSSVRSAEYLVWLEDSEKTGNFYPIKYSLINGDETDYLGTEADKQYASPNMIKIFRSDIYYLAVGGGDGVSGRLYRMRPGAIHKESTGVGVTGYIVLSDDVIYYSDGDNVMKVHSWKDIELKLPDYEELNENGDIVMKLATPSEYDIVNERGETLAVDVSALPTPDFVIETESTADLSNLPIAEKETTISNSETIGQVVPVIGGVKEADTSDQKAPQVVEIEAPQ